VLAVVLLLGSTNPITTVLSVALVVVVAWLLALVPARMGQSSCWYWFESVAGSASATPMQLLYLLVVGLIALSEALGVAILMGALLSVLLLPALAMAVKR